MIIDGVDFAVALVLLILVPIAIMLIELVRYDKRLRNAEETIAHLCGVETPRTLLEGDLQKEEVKI